MHNVGSILEHATLSDRKYVCVASPLPAQKRNKENCFKSNSIGRLAYYKDTSSCLKELKANDVRIVSIEQENATQLQDAEIEHNKNSTGVWP